jgi:probable F420-dependent oxidoreductase
VRVELGTTGVWIHQSKGSPALARELESLGYGAIWVGGSPAGDLAVVEGLLSATDRITIATGIVNIWSAPARTVAASHHRITKSFPRRLLLGIGVGHPEQSSDYRRPYTALVDYLDVLDGEGVPIDERIVAALGPKVLRLAADRSVGAHPYLTTPEHTAEARTLLGPQAVIAPEHKVVVDTSAEQARSVGRTVVARYLGLQNYVANLRRLHWSDADLTDGGSDALVDALVAHGDATGVAEQLRRHLDAGADHVALQLLTAPETDPLPQYAQLAAALHL